jgi:Tfp pilus assembly protein PilX
VNANAIMNPIRSSGGPAGGAALATALLFMLAVLIVGVSAARTALYAEKSARSERDRHIAFQAAEAALTDAERDIEGGRDPGSARAQLFAAASALGFADGCGAGAVSINLGLCSYSPAARAPAWQTAELAGDEGAPLNTVPYGTFTGAALPAGSGTLTARHPRYLIELMPLARAGEDATDRAGNFYRITAIGFGARPSTQVVLQAFYRRVAPAAGAAP